jgi:hypothetical protein
MASSEPIDLKPPSEQADPEQANSEQWYIVKQESGVCQIVPIAAAPEASGLGDGEKWGPFKSQGEAIARRVGLIRAGKCQPL